MVIIRVGCVHICVDIVPIQAYYSVFSLPHSLWDPMISYDLQRPTDNNIKGGNYSVIWIGFTLGIFGLGNRQM